LLWTETALGLCEAIREAFSKDPPQGPVRDWIGAIEPPELRADLAEIQFFAGLKIGGRLIEDAATAETLQSAIQGLRRMREERAIAALKNGADEDKLETIMTRLRGIKGERGAEA
jgi:hypothetical protein